LDHIAIDLKEFKESRQGNNYCLVVVDICTRFVWLRALRSKEAMHVAMAMFDVIANFGLPKIVQSDNGKEFVNKILKEMYHISHIDHRLITAYHPQANGTAERMVQTISQTVYKRLHGRDRDWDLYLPSTQLFVNMKTTRRHGSTPYSLMFARNANEFVNSSGQDPKEPLTEEQLQARLEYMTAVVYPAIQEKTKQTMKAYKKDFAASHSLISDKFIPGSLVMAKNELRTQKAEERFTGPFLVKQRTVNGAYVLTDSMGTEFKRPASSLKLVKKGLPKHLDAAEVKDIVNEKQDNNGCWEYLVEWKHRPTEHEWVKESDFHDLAPIRKFQDKRYKEQNQKVIQKNNHKAKKRKDQQAISTPTPKKLKIKFKLPPSRHAG